MAEAKGSAASTAKSDIVVYVGPNNLKRALKTYTIYKEKPQALIDSLAGEYPNIARLFVSVDDLGHAMGDVKTKGNPLYLAYKEVAGGEE